ncbi:MAG: DNA repair protein RadA [Deltaproteobacteria bacterium]|nr:DNA repair protein RadA [Deltaproteobacteria bacterium]
MAEGGSKVLYATGEESAEQIKMRADRLGISSKLLVIAENSVDRIVAQTQKLKPDLLVVDSIQTVFLPALSSAPGSISQVRESAGKLLYLSKTTGMSTVLIGHITKEGALAGPRTLEHMVDCVLYFEGDSSQHYRILRTTKNRYGSTNEIGVFEMTSSGLLPVDNPSSLFMPGKSVSRPGSSVTASLEGARPFLVEIQALVSSSSLANPRRTTLGVDSGRVAILIAVLEKIVGLNLYAQDIYVTAAGGFKVIEPAADLAILGALVSSFRNKPIVPDRLLIGEVGLSGEVRGVQGIDIRLNEAQKLGFKSAIIPKSKKKLASFPGLELIAVETASQALEALF